ncbi:MAG: hypothetical protein HYY23_14660 [Verrucomicrobia bacterium]|nr:hypothetical protein [Verrucomicrobiota bacterium]
MAINPEHFSYPKNLAASRSGVLLGAQTGVPRGRLAVPCHSWIAGSLPRVILSA